MAATEAAIAEETPSSNGWFQIAISADGSTVLMKKIVRHIGSGKPVESKDILKKLKADKVIHGIDHKVIESLLEANQVPDQEIVIARSDVEEGKDGELRWSVPGIDEPNSETLVAPDMRVAILRKAIKGKSGKNVFGKTRQPRPVFEPQLNAGFGICVEQEECGEFVYKTIFAGEIKYADETISIDPHIMISDDQMQARMHIPVGQVEGAERAIMEQDIRALIAAMNITDGILVENIQATLKKYGDRACLVKDILVAEGKMAKDGVNARLLVDEHFSVGKMLAHGKIDYHEKSYPWNVKTGEVIGRIIPPQMEENGFNIHGKILLAVPAEMANLVLEGIEEETDGKLRILRDGVLLANGLNFSVADNLLIDGDVCHKTGNIHSDKTVTVKGYVEPGFIIESKGDIIIQENVEQSLVRSNGCTVVKSGIRGSQSKIISRRNISASFIENARVKALGDITVDNSMVSCYSYCQGTLSIGKSNSKKSTLIGGTTHAIKGVVAANLGSEGCTKTEVSVGLKPEILQKLQTIEGQLTKLDITIGKLERIYMLHGQSQAKDKNVAMEKIKVTLQARGAELEQLQLEQEKLQAQIEVSRKAQVVIHQNVYPGVCIHILDKRYEVRKKENAGTFFLKDELIIFRPAA